MPIITTYPNSNWANPLNCLNICLKGTDEEFIDDAGTFATAEISIGEGVTPSDGEIIVIAGFTFTFKTTVNGGFNSTEIQIDNDQSVVRDRLKSALEINFNFIDVFIENLDPPFTGISLEWCEKGIQPNFIFDFTTYQDANVTFTNGTNFTLKDKRLLYQLFCVVEGGKDYKVCDPQNPQPQTLDCELIENCFNIGSEIDDILKTTSPPSLTTGPFFDSTIKKSFYLRHGTVEYLNTEKEKNNWRYGYPSSGENASVVLEVRFNNVIIPLPAYPYVVSTANGYDPSHPLSVDLLAWAIGQGFDIEQMGVIYISNAPYFAFLIECAIDFDATQLTFTTNKPSGDPSGTWVKQSTEIILDCSSNFGDFIKHDEFQVLNSLHLNDDPNQFLPYVNGTNGNDFLTNIPSGQSLCCDTFRWLWVCISEGVTTPLFVTIKRFDDQGSLIDEDDQPIVGNDGVLVLPVGPANIDKLYAPFDFTNVCSYSVQVRTISGGLINLSKEYEIKLKKTDCCCDIQIYYKTDAGGYDTICFEKTQSIDFDVEQTEICLDVKCGTNLVEDGKGSVGGTLKENLTLTTKSYQRTRTQRDIFAQFKKSNSRIIKVKDLEGNDIMRSFIVDTGGVRIFQAGEKLNISVSGYYEESEATTEF